MRRRTLASTPLARRISAQGEIDRRAALTVWPGVTGEPFTVAAVTTPSALPRDRADRQPGRRQRVLGLLQRQVGHVGMATTSGPLETTTVTVAPFGTSVAGCRILAEHQAGGDAVAELVGPWA